MNARASSALRDLWPSLFKLPERRPDWLVPVAAFACAIGVDWIWQVPALAVPLFTLSIALLAWQGHAFAAGAAIALALIAGGPWQGDAGTRALAIGSYGPAAGADALLYVGAALLAHRMMARLHGLEEALALAEEHSSEDRLTGLPNRRLLLDRLSVAMAQARRTGSRLALIYLDLDRFKPVNDEFGHKAGDAVLKATAGRLLHLVRASDTVARIGGDEFVVLLVGLGEARDALPVAEKIREALREPIHAFELPPLQVGASIGIASFPEDATEIDSLCASADAAMYRSKARGGNVCTRAERAIPAAAAPWFAFDETMATGVAEIDHQHRHMMELAEGVNDSLRSDAGPATAALRLDELVRYTKQHFACEERLMRESQDPGADRHRRLHAQLLREVAAIRARLDDGASAAALQTLKDWLLDHIEAEDRELARHLLQHERPQA